MFKFTDGKLYYGNLEINEKDPTAHDVLSILNLLLLDGSCHFQNEGYNGKDDFMENFHKLRRLGFPNWKGEWKRD